MKFSLIKSSVNLVHVPIESQFMDGNLAANVARNRTSSLFGIVVPQLVPAQHFGCGKDFSALDAQFVAFLLIRMLSDNMIIQTRLGPETLVAMLAFFRAVILMHKTFVLGQGTPVFHHILAFVALQVDQLGAVFVFLLHVEASPVCQMTHVVAMVTAVDILLHPILSLKDGILKSVISLK